MVDSQMRAALDRRNRAWADANIPGWVNIDSVSLDQFYTNEDVARDCFDQALRYLDSKGVKETDCYFIEPSAGDGAFYRLLPEGRRFGMDICPMCRGIKTQDFLTWKPRVPKGKKIIYIGNPPFGYRGWLALRFMNKCAENADYVFSILPMSFQSVGKGSPRGRVVGLTLQQYATLPMDSYHTVNGDTEKINALWTVWEKGENILPEDPDVSGFVELFTVDLRKERLCGVEKMKDAAFFLQRTFYDVPPKPVKDFSEVKYVCGYGFLIKQRKDKIRSILSNTDWYQYSNLAAHNCHHTSMCHIRRALYDGGLKNE